MSADYFCIEEVKNPSKFNEEYNKSQMQPRPEQCRSNKESDSESKRSQDFRLQEIEEQLQIAENRCNTLKGQLDYMKKVYHKASDTPRNAISSNNRTATPNRKPSNSDGLKQQSRIRLNSAVRQPNREVEGTHAAATRKAKMSENHVQPVRQNPHAVDTDTTGAAVRTINNILTGITDSVNRLSELHAHLETDDKRSNFGRRRTRRDEKRNSGSVFFSEPVIGVEVVNFAPKKSKDNVYHSHTLPADRLEASISEEISRKQSDMCSGVSKTKRRSRFKSHKNMGSKVQTSIASINVIKRSMKVMARHVEKRATLTPVRTGMVDIETNSQKRHRKQVKRLKPSSKTKMRKKDAEIAGEFVEKPFRQYTTDNLVELYHNKAVKSSDSDESNTAGRKKSTTSHCKSRPNAGIEEIVPPLKIDVSINNRHDEDDNKKYNKENKDNNTWLSPIDENNYYEPAAPRADVSNVCSAFSKNYELPTISSKMKQVTKCYLQSFNFKSIPFCAAKSTSPSHNIGINIQQVMSIIKTRQPLQGISPTLAHNIGLAAEKLNSRPLSTLVSSLSSRMWYNRSQCPLIRNPMNYQQLQEMAKEIPEEDETMLGDNQENEGGVNNVIINGPSGDADKQDKDQVVWTTDNIQSRNCTCIRPNGVGFSQVLSKYHSGQNPGSQYTMPPLKQFAMPKRQYMQDLRNRTQTIRAATVATHASQEPEPNLALTEKESKPLKGREKTLKEVLKNLHNDFDALNNKYEELSTKAREGTIETNAETLKALEDMEKSLNNKEEEITMVMALYKEVMALKKQVKTLKERTSQASFPVKDSLSRFKEYKDPTAALHLTKLLRQIQSYQMTYKKGGTQ